MATLLFGFVSVLLVVVVVVGIPWALFLAPLSELNRNNWKARFHLRSPSRMWTFAIFHFRVIASMDWISADACSVTATSRKRPCKNHSKLITHTSKRQS